MSRPIITCENISKCYRLGVRKRSNSYGPNFTFRESVSDAIQSAMRSIRNGGVRDENANGLFWALQGHFV